MSSGTRSGQSGGGSGNGEFVLVIEGLPSHYTWQDVKDLARNRAEHGIRANDYVPPWSTSSGSKLWMVSLTRKNEAVSLYTWLASRLLDGRRIILHLKENGAVIFNNCTGSNCGVCRPPSSAAPAPYFVAPTPIYTAAPAAVPMMVSMPSGVSMRYPASVAPGPAIYQAPMPLMPNQYPPTQPLVSAPSIETRQVHDMIERIRAKRAAGREVSSREMDFLQELAKLNISQQQQSPMPPLRTSSTGAPPSMYTATTASGALVNTSSGFARTEQRGVFVSGLGFKIRQADVEGLFARAGKVVRCEVQTTSQGKSRGTATVQFETVEAARRAVDAFDQFSWKGRTLRVRSDREAVVTEAPVARSSGSQSSDFPSEEPIIADGSNSRQARRDSKISNTSR